MRRRLLNLLMVALCLGQMVTVAAAKTPDESYVDVPCTSPYYEAVEYLTSMGVTSGVGAGRFAPDNIITFDEFIVMLMKTMQPEAVAAEYPSNHWNRQALWAAINAGS